MAEFTSYEAGTPSWIDLQTRDVEAATAYLEELFGWTHNDLLPDPDSGIYRMFGLRGRDVAAVSKMQDAMAVNEAIPAFWTTYVTVADVDATAERVGPAGGTLAMPPFDAHDAGRMAVAVDPTGATIAFWQPKEHIGAGLANEAGTLIWNELQTRDIETAGAFYKAVLGWEPVNSTVNGGTYVEFHNNGRAVAGMTPISPEMGPVPPNWLVYFCVDDCDTTLTQATGLGAQAVVAATDVDGVGRFGVLHHSAGGVFAVLEPAAGLLD
jgi:predicted enzyme related to lactoylglutathione lyase